MIAEDIMFGFALFVAALIVFGFTCSVFFLWPISEGYRFPLPLTASMRRRNHRIRLANRRRALLDGATACKDEAYYWREAGEDEMKVSILKAEAEAALREAERIEEDMRTLDRAEREAEYRRLTGG